MPWKDILQDPIFGSMTPEYQKRTAINYFNANIANKDEYLGLQNEDRDLVRANFFGTIGQDVPYEIRHPLMAGIGAAAKRIGYKMFPDPALEEEYLGSIPTPVRKTVHEAAESVAGAVSGLFTGESQIKDVGREIVFNSYNVATQPWMQFSDLLPQSEEHADNIAYRTGKAILKNLEFTTTPAMGVIGKASQASNVLARVISTAFAVDMSFHAGDQAAEALKAFEEGRRGDFVEAIVNTAFGAAFGYLSMKHATDPESIARFTRDTTDRWKRWEFDDPELKSTLDQLGRIFDEAKAEQSAARNGTLELGPSTIPDPKELPRFASQVGPGYQGIGYTVSRLPHEGLFGKGGYYTNDPSFIKTRVGEGTVFTRDINLRNPRVTTPEEMMKIYAEAVEALRGRVPDAELRSAANEVMQKYFKDQGFDGLVIKDGVRDYIVDFTDTGVRQLPKTTLENKSKVPNFMTELSGTDSYNPKLGIYEIKVKGKAQSDAAQTKLNENDFELTRFRTETTEKTITDQYISTAENGDPVVVNVIRDLKNKQIKGITSEPLNEAHFKPIVDNLTRIVDAYVYSYESMGGRYEIAKQVSQLERIVSRGEGMVSDPSIPELRRHNIYQALKPGRELLDSPQFQRSVNRVYDIRPDGVNDTSAGFFDNLVLGIKETARAAGEFLKPEPGALGSFGVFSESAYVKAKPHLSKAWAAYRRAGGVAEAQFTRFYRDFVDRFGVGVIPYIQRFGQEMGVALNAVSPAALSFEEKYAKNLVEADKIRRRKHSLAYLKNEAVRAIYDTSGNLRKGLKDLNIEEAEKALQYKVLARGASGEAIRQIQEVDKAIFKGLTRADMEILNKVIAIRRVLAVEEYKPGRGYFQGVTPEECAAYLNNIRSTFPQDIVTRVEHAANKYFELMHKHGIDQLRAEQVISQEQYDTLKALGPYSPQEYLQHLETYDTQVIGGKTLSTTDPAVSFLSKEGSLGVMETKADILVQHVINRVQNSIFKHRANKALYDLAVASPDNPIVKIAPIVKRTKTGKPIFKDPQNGWSNVHMLHEGRDIVLQLPNEFAREWVTSDPAINRTYAEIAGWVLGTKILKATATGYNPGFLIRNAAMDLPHIWLTTREYSSLAPVAMMQQGIDLMATAKSAFTRKGLWIDAQKQGISMDFLAEQGAIKVGKIKPLNNTLEVLGWLNKTSEIWSRLALYRRALHNTGDPTYAAFVARDYLDFSQGGSFVKMMDVAVPYLNASVQGTRGVLRAAKRDKGVFVWKAAQIGLLSMGLTYAGYVISPEAMQDISEETRNGYFVIPLGNTYRIDSSGNKRYKYIKIRKDQGQRAIAAFFEEAMKAGMGKDYDFMRAAKGIKDILAFLPEDLNIPLIQAFRSYQANYDFWRDEPIWKGSHVAPEREYTPYTHPALKELGRIAHLSPERARVFMSQFIAPNNTWIQLAGGAIKKLTQDLTPEEQTEINKHLLRQISIIGGVVSETSKYAASKKMVSKLSMEENTRRLTQEQELRVLFDKYYESKQGEKFSNMFSYITKQHPKDHLRLSNMVERWLMIKHIDPVDISWWMSISNKLPEVRAEALMDRYLKTDEPGRRELMSTAYRIPGFWTDKVVEEFERLKQFQRGAKQ